MLSLLTADGVDARDVSRTRSGLLSLRPQIRIIRARQSFRKSYGVASGHAVVVTRKFQRWPHGLEVRLRTPR
jgi:hypothetical protein